MTFEQAKENYHTDPHFKALVDTLCSHILNLETTPSELRAAVMFAAIKVDSMRIKPMFMGKENDHESSL